MANRGTGIEIIETSLLQGRVKLLQPKVGFHAAIDTVFLAAAAPLKDKHLVLDIGCGVGSAGLCLFARNPNIHLTGIDIQRDLIDIALQNAALNEVDGHCRFFHGDIRHEKLIADNVFNLVLMNPPYLEAGTHLPSPEKIKATANGESATLTEWVKYAHKKLKQGGDIVIVHRADRLDDLITALTARRWFGSLTIYPLWPRAGEIAKRIIVTARKERYAPLRLMAGLTLHNTDGSYTNEAQHILSRAGALE